MFDEALECYEEFLKTMPHGEGMPLGRYSMETGRRPEQEERFRELMHRYGVYVSATPLDKPPRKKRRER